MGAALQDVYIHRSLWPVTHSCIVDRVIDTTVMVAVRYVSCTCAAQIASPHHRLRCFASNVDRYMSKGNFTDRKSVV